jgi:electron transport complex protein RnfD
MTFGGLGKNPFNPALVGRVFLFISFPVQMTNWPVPIESRLSYIDSVTGATVLSRLKEGLSMGKTIPQLVDTMPTHKELFLGFMGGSLGEIAAGALILGFLWLLFQKIITWHIPITILGTIFVFDGLLHILNPEQFADPFFHILSGGILLGAIFMATDYVTSPMTNKGKIIYAVGIGFLTVIIRIWGAYPEGIQFAILILNGFVPLINRYIKPKRFGEVITAKN